MDFFDARKLKKATLSRGSKPYHSLTGQRGNAASVAEFSPDGQQFLLSTDSDPGKRTTALIFDISGGVESIGNDDCDVVSISNLRHESTAYMRGARTCSWNPAQPSVVFAATKYWSPPGQHDLLKQLKKDAICLASVCAETGEYLSLITDELTLAPFGMVHSSCGPNQLAMFNANGIGTVCLVGSNRA